ncbi:hypothetical protein BC827DRAFT_1269060 [Russula dissimulans]|nr:hypothetical protein BC827DRAFT_1269060 [Russula dissimulans]
MQWIKDEKSDIVVPDGGLPTYAGEKWAEPIAAAQPSQPCCKKCSSAAANSAFEKAGGNSESEKAKTEQEKQEDGKSALDRGRTVAVVVVPSALQDALLSVLDVELAFAAPGGWGEPDVEW